MPAEAPGFRSNPYLACTRGAWQTLILFSGKYCHNCNERFGIASETTATPYSCDWNRFELSRASPAGDVPAGSMKQLHDHDVDEVPDPERRKAEHSKPAERAAPQQMHGQCQHPDADNNSDPGSYGLKHHTSSDPAFSAGAACAIFSSSCRRALRSRGLDSVLRSR